MKRNWFAVYIKLNYGKKVAGLLSKKGIKSYYPLTGSANSNLKKKVENVPLLPEMVFVYATDEEVAFIKNTRGVINFVYWLGKPVVINNDEILYLQYFTSEYPNVELEKSTVRPGNPVTVITEPHIDRKGRHFFVKNTTIRLLLPSLGYTLNAVSEASQPNIFTHRFNINEVASSHINGKQALPGHIKKLLV